MRELKWGWVGEAGETQGKGRSHQSIKGLASIGSGGVTGGEGRGLPAGEGPEPKPGREEDREQGAGSRAWPVKEVRDSS